MNNEENQKNRSIGLYVHVPFCRSKCRYCDFYSLPSPSYETMENYVHAASAQLAVFGEEAAERGLTVDTVYIGGGTPTALGETLLPRLLSSVNDSFVLKRDAEFTVEANPATVTPTILSAMRREGVNRLSFGVQSANDKELQTLGRIHRFDDFENSFLMARACGFTNISADLMLSIPYQTPESCRASLERVLALSPEHLSLYGLRIEEGTPFFALKDTLPLPDEDVEREMYLSAVSFLSEKGYVQYEISNFAKEGFASRHNLRYWNRLPYLGIGPGAHSFYRNSRFSLPRDLSSYLQQVPKPASVLATEGETLSEKDALEETLFLGFRLTDGVSLSFLQTLIPNTEALRKKLVLWERYGLLTMQNDAVSLTPEGMLVSNTILSDLLLLEESDS